jgi:hypothetical protein
MRAIIHLGFFRGLFEALFEPPYRPAASSASVSGGNLASNGWHGSSITHDARNSLSKFHSRRINRLQASQIAAALLVDLGTVDIR